MTDTPEDYPTRPDGCVEVTVVLPPDLFRWVLLQREETLREAEEEGDGEWIETAAAATIAETVRDLVMLCRDHEMERAAFLEYPNAINLTGSGLAPDRPHPKGARPRSRKKS